MSWSIYLHYDEDSLSLHSNAGLLRRAKKSLDEVQLQQRSATELNFQVEDCVVKLSPKGIAQAACDCPASSCCKHILSSILWMQQHAEQFGAAPASSGLDPASTATPAPVPATESDIDADTGTVAAPATQSATTATDADAAANTLAQALKLPVAKTLKQVNKANRRVAYQLFLEWQQHPEQCQIEILADKITFQTELSPNKVQLFAALGLSGMLSDIAEKQQSAAHLACLAQLFYAHQAELWQWPEDLVSAEVNQSNPILSANDLSLIAELQQMCRYFIQHGLSHIAKESVLALHILNMQARAQNLPRLGSELRQLYGLMKQRLAEDVQITEQQIFDRLAMLYSYLAALMAVKDQAEALQPLRGVIQQQYQQQQFEHLIPIGCEWWQYDSGARGLSVCFWDASANHMLEVTQARANHLDSTFDKASVAQSGIWGSNLDYLLQHQLRLTQAKTSSAYRLSASSDTRFEQIDTFKALSLEQFDQHHIGIRDWQQLDALIHPQSSIQANQQRYVLLRHQEMNAPELNEIEQCFECRVVDEHGLSLKLSLPIEPEYQSRIEHFSQLVNHEKPFATLVRLDLSQRQIRLIPCSVMLQRKKQLSIFSLDYHYPPRRPKGNVFELIAGRIEKMLKQKKQWQQQQLRSPLELLLDQTQPLLEYYANIGRAQFDPLDQQKFEQLTQQFEDLGLSLIAQSFKAAQRFKTAQNPQAENQHINLPHALLQWRQLLNQLQRLQYRFSLEGQVMSP